MPPWKLTAEDPLILTLAADARLCQTDYCDDQIWELRLGGSEPQALALETTYGLRAHRMRLFPRFLKPGVDATDPANFYQPPQITAFYPNALSLAFHPFEGLEAQVDYWIPDSKTIAGRFKLHNYSILPQTFRFEWAALLAVRDLQGQLVTVQTDSGFILAGETDSLQPVIYLAGGAQPANGPYPALSLEIELYPGGTKQFTWAAAACESSSLSVEVARQAAQRSFEPEMARIELLNTSQTIKVETGIPDWDAAFALSQKSALELLMKNTAQMPNASFVLTRRIDQGYSSRGDGSDYPALWRGQSALDSLFLNSLLPGSPQIAADLVRNFLAGQEEAGFIDWRPGLGGQRTRRLAQPLLATLAVQAAPPFAEQKWYQEVYTSLKQFFYAWFAPERDADGDGLPEYETAFQTGLDESPIHDLYTQDRHGVEAHRFESPALAAMLYTECQSLITMAEATGAEDDLPAYQQTLIRLKQSLNECWNEQEGLYHYRDTQTHLTLPSASLVSFQGNGTHHSRRRFKQPRRLSIRLEARDERTYAALIKIHGFTPQGEVTETLSPRSFSWFNNEAHATTENTFFAVDEVDAQGLGDKDRVRVLTPDFSLWDCSLLLPLWAGASSDEQARKMIETQILPRLLQPFGVPVSPGLVETVSIPWNMLIAEGLLRYGYRAQAADLVTRLMNAIVPTLKRQRAFQQNIHAQTGQPIGERGHLHGFAPLGLFLHTLGIKQIDQKQIIIDGLNPYQNQIHVQYRKVALICCSDRTEITFPAGQQIVIDQPGPHRLTLF